MGHGRLSDMGHWLFLKSTCDIGEPPSRAPGERSDHPISFYLHPISLYLEAVTIIITLERRMQ